MKNFITTHFCRFVSTDFTSLLFFLFVLIFMAGCEEKPELSDTEFLEALVVEGRIESGQFARVFITRNIPFYVHIDSADFPYLVIRQAKVEVSDGVQSEVLVLRYDKKIFPYHYYQGVKIRGVPGKSYTLKITHGEKELIASTTIPHVPMVDSVWFSYNHHKQGLGTINVAISDEQGYKPYYRIYTMNTPSQNRYFPALISNFDSRFFIGNKYTLSLSKGPESYMRIDNSEFFFADTDSVMVKVCAIDEQQFRFWSSYQMQVTGGSNPFAASSSNVNSNIIGGLGNWGGFAVAYKPWLPKKENRLSE
jgi:hypothetical protein